MNALTFTAINNEPRILDLDLAERLGFDRPNDIRKIIERNQDKLEGYGPLRMELIQSPGRTATAFYLNEHQALLICGFARTEKAKAIRKEVIEVFIAHRRGQLVAAQVEPQMPSQRHGVTHPAALNAFGKVSSPLALRVPMACSRASGSMPIAHTL